MRFHCGRGGIAVKLSGRDGYRIAELWQSRARLLMPAVAIVLVASSIVVPARVAAVSPATLSGTVTDTSGHPVPGLEIILGSYPTEANPNVAAYTNASGAYTASAAAGDYGIYLYDPTGKYIYGCFDPNQTGSFVALSGPVMCALETLTDGQAVQINFAIPPARHLSGRVTTSDGSRPDRIFIDPLDAGGNIQGEIQAVGADGSFTFTLPPGQYQFAVSGTIFYADGCYKAGAPGGFSADGVACSLLDATAADVSGINMTLPRNAVVGHLIEGTVTGPGGVALPGIKVEPTPTDMLGFTTFTDGAGHYSALVTSGDYQVSVSDPGKRYASGCYASASPGHFDANCQSPEIFTVGSSDVSAIDMTLPIGGETASGTDVWVDPSQSAGSGINASVNFSVVGTAGTTTLAVSASGPVPAGFSLGTDGVFYDISSTATYQDAITICFGFDPAAFSDPSTVRLYHYDQGSWQDVTTTVDYQSLRICGTASSLSPFAIGEKASQVQQPQTISFAPIPDQILGGAGVALSATASSGLPVEFLVSGSCAISAGSVVATSAGSCSVVASQPGNELWAAAAPVTRTFLIRAAATVPTPATYHPIAPTRLLDTRHANGLSGRLLANNPVTFPITRAARADTPIPAAATAVTGNLTVTGSTFGWAVYLGPDPIASPASSTINFGSGETTANGLSVALSTDGKLSATFMSKPGNSTDLVFDVTGYFTPNSSGATYHAMTPARLLDTRFANGLSARLVSNTPVCFWISQANRPNSTVPASATAVTGNVTVVNETSSWAVYVGPDPVASPSASTLNFSSGDVKANNLTVALGAGGRLCLTYLSIAGQTTDLVFDVTGYYTADATGARFVPLAPARVLDTRVANGLPGKIVANTPVSVTVAGKGGVPAEAVGVTGNVAVVNETSGWAVYVGPAAVSSPSTSSLNFRAGDVRANGLTAALSRNGSDTGNLWLTYMSTAGNKTDLVIDVTGYFVP